MLLRVALEKRLIKKTCHPKKHDENCMREFPSGPVAKTPHSQCRGDPGFMSAQETRSHMPQLKILRGTAKPWYTQKTFEKKKKKD